MGLAVVTAPVVRHRLYHLTFYKCGSQWIRDILADPRLAAESGHSLAASGVDLQANAWPTLHTGQLASPLYSSALQDWCNHAEPADRAFVVIRDPRDIVVSLVHSVSTSHTPSATTALLRAPLASAEPVHRMQLGMFLLTQWADALRSWRDAATIPNVHLVKYADLIDDLPGQLHRLFQFLGWSIQPATIAAIAAENSFENRSGRKPGTENPFSHRRKGIAGDWRNHFDRTLGQLFERAFPGLLSDLGYESSPHWWCTLPESLLPHESDPEDRQAQLMAVLEEQQQELATIRAAAEQRLADVETLHDILAIQTAVADQRLADLESQEAARRELEKSFSWRFGFRPLRAIGALFHS